MRVIAVGQGGVTHEGQGCALITEGEGAFQSEFVLVDAGLPESLGVADLIAIVQGE